MADMPNEVLVFSPWKTHWSMPSSCTTLGASSAHFFGTWFSYMCGGSIMWSSMLTRIMSSMFMCVLLSRGHGVTGHVVRTGSVSQPRTVEVRARRALS